MADVTAATGLVTIDGVQRTPVHWWRKGGGYDSVAAFLAGTEAPRADGEIVYYGGFRGTVSSAAAANTYISNSASPTPMRVVPLPGQDGSYHIDACGAVGDGSTDDSAARDIALTLAQAAIKTFQYPGSLTYATNGPAVIFGSKRYRINSSLTLGSGSRHVVLKSEGTTVILGDPDLTKGVDFLIVTGLRMLHVEGIHFHNFDTVFHVSSGNLNSSHYAFRYVRTDAVNVFLDTDTYALSRSTQIDVAHCVFESATVQVMRSYADKINVRDSWIGAKDSTTDSFHVNAHIGFDNCVFIPAGTATQFGGAWVRLTEDDGDGGTIAEEHRGVHFQSCRFSNESSNPPIVVCDYGVVTSDAAQTPNISLNACTINGYHGAMYEEGNAESGLVYLLQYPASISFTDCGFFSLGNAEGALVAKSDSLSAAPHSGFTIDVDEASMQNAMRAVGQTNTKKLARSLRTYINNPDPYTFRGILEDGFLDVVDTATTGKKKATINIKTGWTDASYRHPITFEVTLGGLGQSTGTNNIQYAGSSTYLVTISGMYDGAHKSEISVTKLHGTPYGNTDVANADIISAHFGTGDTGDATEALATSHDVTLAFGTNINYGMGQIGRVYFRKWLKQWDVMW